LELATFILAKLGYLLHEIPTYSNKNIQSDFWVEIDPSFGVWHLPHSSYRHRRACFDVQYQANKFGMRDPERKTQGNPDRTVILGDSFVEGFGIPFGERFSDILESSRNREHLNFGTSGHFGPTQYYLLYKNLAKEFTHDEVIIGIYPKNDFTDDNYDIWKGSGRYRPFWVGEYPNYKLIYSSDKLRGVPSEFSKSINGFLREYTYTYNLFVYLKGLYNFKLKELRDKKRSTQFSGFYDFKESDWNRLKFSLEKISEEARGKRIIILFFPSPNDVKRYALDGPSPLGNQMEEFSKSKGFEFINLLPFIDSLGPNWEHYYNFPCDKHFNSAGNAAVAQYIQEKLEKGDKALGFFSK